MSDGILVLRPPSERSPATSTSTADKPHASRRAGYDNGSPTIGERGSQTRGRIIGEALTLFSEQGLHATTARDIAACAGVSRATLYQYFDSVEEIFVELMDECAGALINLVRGIGPLGPTAAGFATLHAWISDWAHVSAKYGALFVQWAEVDLPDDSINGIVASFLHAFNLRIAHRFRDCGLVGLNDREAAILTTEVVYRFNYLHQVNKSSQVPSDNAIRSLATLLQNVLFPATPASVLPVSRSVRPRRTPADVPAPQVPLAVVPRGSASDRALTPARAATVARILDAGAARIAEIGFHRTYIDDITRRAHVARTVFYRYFETKRDLLLALSDECETALRQLTETFVQVPPGPAGYLQRRAWMLEYLTFREHYIGVLRTWVERWPREPTLDLTRARVVRLLDDSMQSWIDASPIADSLDIGAAKVLMIGTMERLPDAMAEDGRTLRPTELADLMSTILERGIYRMADDSPSTMRSGRLRAY